MLGRRQAVALALTVGVSAGCQKPAATATTQVSSSRSERKDAREAAEAPAPGGKPAAVAPVAEAERHIIFNGHLDVVVKDFDAAQAKLVRLVAQTGGYFAKTDVSGDAGRRRTGTFALKIPSAKFQPTVDELARLGVAVRNGTDSQDVTEEFVDVQSRIRNLKAEEETLNRILKDTVGRLDDMFKVREQIRQVRGEIERAEGRLKLLSALTALSTIQLTLREEADYVPPTVEPPATFAAHVSATFDDSLARLRRLGEGVVIVLTALAPWLPFLVAGWFVARWAVRRIVATIPAAADRPAPSVARRMRLPESGDDAPSPSGPPADAPPA